MSQSPQSRSDRPNLEQKKKLAKDLLKAVKRLDQQQAARFTWNHSRFRGKTGQDVVREGVALADCQHVIARESGFDSWPKLVEYVRELESDPAGPSAAFEDAVRAIIRGESEALRKLLATHPDLATTRSRRQHHGLLLHYIAANGVENEHQITPPNAVEITQLLIDAGANEVIDETADIYGGGAGSTPLVALVTSGHPHQAGLQHHLVKLFCEAGANPNGIDNDGLPLHCALGFRYPLAAKALVDNGAAIENLPSAAAVGDLDLLNRFLEPTEKLPSRSCMFPNPNHDRIEESKAPHPDSTMQQALVFAAMCDRKDVVQRLLDEGVDIKAGPRSGITALHEAAFQGNLKMVQFLIQQGADPTQRDQCWNSTVIGWAEAGNHANVMETVFQNGAVDFHDAVEQRRFSLVRKMLEADAALANAPNGNGGVLRYAAQQGDKHLVLLLLEFNADPTLRNDAGHSALDFAKKSGHTKIAEILSATLES